MPEDCRAVRDLSGTFSYITATNYRLSALANQLLTPSFYRFSTYSWPSWGMNPLFLKKAICGASSWRAVSKILMLAQLHACACSISRVSNARRDSKDMPARQHMY